MAFRLPYLSTSAGVKRREKDTSTVGINNCSLPPPLTLLFHLTFSGFNSLRLDPKTSNVGELKGENMKRYKLAISLTAVVTFALLAVVLRAQIYTAAQRLNDDPRALSPAVVLLGDENHGVVFKTAAINSDASVANCFRCVKANTVHLGTGFYQVAFDENVQATNGWSRWVQPDTLAAGEENAWCNTADRSGDPNAIFVNCQHEGGPGSQGNSVPVDTSFFIFVAR
jgi:hypothetical protein